MKILLGLNIHFACSRAFWKGAWHLTRTGSLQKALSNTVLRGAGFLMPSDLAAMSR
jgi:hypothetical protein